MTLNLLGLRLSKLITAFTEPRFVDALAKHRVMAASEHRAVLRKRWATIVDIGANRGQFSLAARAWTPARIIAFEPLATPAATFRAVFADDSMVFLHGCAIGPSAEDRDMRVSGREDSSSLLEIGEEQSRLFPGTAEVGRQTVSVRPLDALVKAEQIAAPALLKLDVQGFEYEALQGCATLLTHFDSIYCECSFVELYRGQKLASAVLAFLAQQGFVLSGFYNPTYDDDGQCVQADILFTKVPTNP